MTGAARPGAVFKQIDERRFAFERLDDAALIYDRETRETHCLRDQAARIAWALKDGPAARAELGALGAAIDESAGEAVDSVLDVLCTLEVIEPEI